MAQTRQRRGNPGFGALDGTMARWSPFWRPDSRSNYLICYIDVVGFVGVMLVPLFLFTPQARDVDAKGVAVDMPRVNNPISMRSADREDAMLIAVTRDNKVYFGTYQVQPLEVPARIRESVAHGAEEKIYIKVDARAKYAWVAEVVDGVHDAGIEKIGFLVDRRRTPSVIPQ